MLYIALGMIRLFPNLSPEKLYKIEIVSNHLIYTDKTFLKKDK